MAPLVVVDSAPSLTAAEVARRQAALETLSETYPATEFTVHGLGNSRTWVRWRDGADEGGVSRVLSSIWAQTSRNAEVRVPLTLDRDQTTALWALGLLRAHRAGALDLAHIGTYTPARVNAENPTETEQVIVEQLAAMINTSPAVELPHYLRADLAEKVATFADALYAAFD